MSAAATVRRLRSFSHRHLHLQKFFRDPGDGRCWPDIPAAALLWALVIGFVLRVGTFHAIESLVGSACRAVGVTRRFSDDALAYFTERLDPGPLRRTLAAVLRRTKRSKAFGYWIGLALDGTGAGHSRQARCPLCRPDSNGAGFHHRLVAISVVGTGLSLPVDVEPYGPGDSEQTAAQRLLTRAVGHLGQRFADYVVADGLYAQAPFLHLAQQCGLYAIVRLKDNLPALFAAAQARFVDQPPQRTFLAGVDTVELWDADDFDPWETLRWERVRVLRYRQHHPDGTLHEAYWLTNFPAHVVGPQTLYAMAKSRWEIENQLFNDAKNRYGFTHVRHHHENSLLVCWLALMLGLVLERLYRRHLHRGTRLPYAAAELVRLLWLGIGVPQPSDTS